MKVMNEKATNLAATHHDSTSHDPDSLTCRAAFDAPVTAAPETMFMPGGLHAITPFAGGVGAPITVLVDRAGAAAIEAQRSALAAGGKKPFFDHSHNPHDDRASFWPEEFFWKDAPAPGIYARGEWSGSGRAAVEGKDYRQFSPVFHVDKKLGTSEKSPARIVNGFEKGIAVGPNMGGLLNNAAFKKISPLWAKDDANASAAGALPENQKEKNATMFTEQELAALQAKNAELQIELDALKAKEAGAIAKKENTDLIASELKAKEFEIKNNAAILENEALKAKAAALEDEKKVRTEADADDAVQAAVKRGAIAAKDIDTQKKWKALICADSSAAALLAGVPGAVALGGRITPAANATDARRVEVGAMSAKDAVTAYGAMHAKQKSAATFQEKSEIARAAALIWAADLRNNDAFLDMPLVAANALGTVAGTLVTQRTLELLKFQFPVLQRITTDFSDEQVKYGQTFTTRTRSIPTVGTYSTSTGYAQTDQTATDISGTIDRHKFVQSSFNANNLASTARNLFSEFAEGNAYAIAKEFVDAVYALILAATYTNTVIVAALADFSRNTVIDMGVALNLLGVPQGPMNRTLLLYSTYFGSLAKDAAIVALAAFQKSEVITDGNLPNVHGFTVVDAPNLPGNSENLVGAGFSHSAFAVAGRLPIDYTQALPGASFGNISVVTNPDGGMSVMQTEYVDHILGTANQRLAWMYGKAAGQAASLQRLTSA